MTPFPNRVLMSWMPLDPYPLTPLSNAKASVFVPIHPRKPDGLRGLRNLLKQFGKVNSCSF